MNRQIRTMQNGSSGAGWLVAASVVLSVLVICVCLFCETCPPQGIGNIPDPKDTVNNCFEALVQERYADCDECLYDFSVADMAQKPQTAAGQRLRELLVDSYSYELSNDCEIVGMDAKQTVSVTYLNLEKFALAVKERANSFSEELNFLGTDVFTEEAALDIAVQAINDLEDEAGDFRDTVQITVELRYDGTQWQVLYNADLENMIMGVGIKKQ